VIPDGWRGRALGRQAIVPPQPGIRGLAKTFCFGHGRCCALARRLVGPGPGGLMAGPGGAAHARWRARDLVVQQAMATTSAEWASMSSGLLGLPPGPIWCLAALGVPRQGNLDSKPASGQPWLWMGVGGSFSMSGQGQKKEPRPDGSSADRMVVRLYQEPHRWRRMLSLPAFAWRLLPRG